MSQLKVLNLPRYPLVFAVLLLAGLLVGISAARAETVQVREATDLYQIGAQARERQLPILIMFSMHGCPYCDIVREEFLKPMLISGEYRERVIIREIHSDSFDELRDFDGQAISAEDLAHRYNASLSPTVVFVDHAGNELAPRMVGVTTVDYYGGYLDEAIEASLQRMRQVELARQEPQARRD